MNSLFYDARVFDRRRIADASAKEGFLQSFTPFHLASKATRRTAERVDDSDPDNNNGDDGDSDDTNDNEDDDDDDGVGGGYAGGLLSSRLGRQMLNILRENFQERNRRASPPPEEEVGDSRRRRRRRRVRIDAHLDPLGDHALSKYSITSAVYSAQGDGEFIVTCSR